MRREWECFPLHHGLAIPTCITARASRTCRDACRDRLLSVSFEFGGGKNLPGIPGAYATRNFAHQKCIVSWRFHQHSVWPVGKVIHHWRMLPFPQQDMAKVLLGRWSWLVAVLIAGNAIGSLNGGILAGSRLCFASARECHLPRFLSLIHYRSLAPVVSLCLQVSSNSASFNSFTPAKCRSNSKNI